MDRTDALDAFIAVVNVVEPDHPHEESPYPLTRADVDYGVTRTKLATCGPRREESEHTVGYSTRLTYIDGCSREEHLALLTHELTHVSIGSHTSEQHGMHPPRFWKRMAFYAVDVYRSLTEGELAAVFPDADPERYVYEVVNDANKPNVDRRYWSVDECQRKMREIISYCKENNYTFADLPARAGFDSDVNSLESVYIQLAMEHIDEALGWQLYEIVKDGYNLEGMEFSEDGKLSIPLSEN